VFSLNVNILSRIEAPSTFGCGSAALCSLWLFSVPPVLNSSKHKLGAQRITAEEFSPSAISGKEASSPGDDLESVTNVAHERVVRKWLLQKS
jgi:hypothetical protein